MKKKTRVFWKNELSIVGTFRLENEIWTSVDPSVWGGGCGRSQLLIKITVDYPPISQKNAWFYRRVSAFLTAFRFKICQKVKYNLIL